MIHAGAAQLTSLHTPNGPAWTDYMAMDKVRKQKIKKLLGSDVQQYLFKDRPREAKCSQAEKEIRKSAIRRMIVAGINLHEVLEFCAEHWQIQEKQVKKYLSEIYAEFKRLGKRDAEVNYGLAIERLETALFECISGRDMGNRVKILKELADVQGIKTLNVDLTSKGEKLTYILSEKWTSGHRPEHHDQPPA